jgi:hypothetical protein
VDQQQGKHQTTWLSGTWPIALTQRGTMARLMLPLPLLQQPLLAAATTTTATTITACSNNNNHSYMYALCYPSYDGMLPTAYATPPHSWGECLALSSLLLPFPAFPPFSGGHYILEATQTTEDPTSVPRPKCWDGQYYTRTILHSFAKQHRHL